MSTYDQWKKAYDRGSVSRVVWVCGSESLLMDEIVSSQLVFSGAPEFSRFEVSAKDLRSVREALFSPSLYDETSKHILVSDAELLASSSLLIEWLDQFKEHPLTWVTFLSAKSNFPFLDEDRTILPSFWESLKKRGRVVRCLPLSEKSGVLWVQRRLPCLDGEARYLMERCNGDLRTAASVCFKLSVLDASPSKGIVDMLTPRMSSGEYVRDLLQLKKDAALLSLPVQSEVAATLSLLSTRLGTMEKLYKLLTQRKTFRDIAAGDEVSLFLAKDLYYSSKHYPPAQIFRRRKLLAEISSLHNRGGADSALLALTALW